MTPPARVHVRLMDLDHDLPMLRVGIRDFVSRMDYRDFLPASDEELVASLRRHLELGCVEVLVAEHVGKLVGGIGLLYAPCIWNSAIMIMEELFLWASKEAPATTVLLLLRNARRQARQKGCQLMTFRSLTSSPVALDDVYRRMGLIPVETIYMGVC